MESEEYETLFFIRRPYSRLAVCASDIWQSLSKIKSQYSLRRTIYHIIYIIPSYTARITPFSLLHKIIEIVVYPYETKIRHLLIIIATEIHQRSIRERLEVLKMIEFFQIVIS